MATINGVDEKGSTRQAGLVKDRLKVRAVSTDEVLFAVQDDRAYQTYTSKINVTGTTKQIMFFLKNDDVDDIFITSATVGTSVSTGGTDNIILLEQVANIGVADPIISGTAVLVTQRNGGSPRPFVGSALKGPAALGGSEVFTSGALGDFTGSRTFDLTAQIPKGGSLAMSMEPPAGNTSMDITIAVAFHVLNGI